MRLWVRADASIEIGTGHIYRCLSIAKSLQKHEIEVIFLCRPFAGNLIDFIRQQGFECRELVYRPVESLNLMQEMPSYQQKKTPYEAWLEGTWQQDITAVIESAADFKQVGANRDVWLVDHFGLDYRWHEAHKQVFKAGLIAIDGQANRGMAVDIVIEPSPCKNLEKWQSVIAQNTRALQGFEWIPLAPKFLKLRSSCQIRFKLNQVLIAFGGVDKPNLTLKALEVAQDYFEKVVVVVGRNFQGLVTLQERCHRLQNVSLHVQTDQLPELMLESDFAIGAGGTMVWERAYLGLPTIITAIAENQNAQIRCALSKKIVKEVPFSENYAQELDKQLRWFQENSHQLVEMSKNALELSQNVGKSWGALVSFMAKCDELKSTNAKIFKSGL